MYLLFTVLNSEEIIDDLITGWIDMGITDSTVIETTDALQLISHQVPIFAGFRILTSGGVAHNKTIFTTIKKKKNLDFAVEFLKKLCKSTDKSNVGSYFIVPIKEFGILGDDEE